MGNSDSSKDCNNCPSIGIVLHPKWAESVVDLKLFLICDWPGVGSKRNRNVRHSAFAYTPRMVGGLESDSVFEGMLADVS